MKNLFKKLCAVIALCTLSTVAQAEAPKWSIDPDKSEILFDVKLMSGTFTGRFESFKTEIFFDPENPQSGKVTAEIDVASARTGAEDRDKTLAGPDWFNIAVHPTARFESNSFSRTGPNTFQVEGTLSILDTSRDISFPFTLTPKDSEKENVVEMEATLTLNRADWQLGRGDWADPTLISNEVVITIGLLATRQ